MNKSNPSLIEQEKFWKELSDRLNAVAFSVCRESNLPCWAEAEDLAQEALIAAIRLVEKQSNGNLITAEFRVEFKEEAFQYAKKALKNKFIDHLRKIKKLPEMLDYGDFIELLYFLDTRCKVGTPEDIAIANDLVEKVWQAASGSRSESYKKLADALIEHAENDGLASLTSKKLIRQAGVSANQRRDFAKMLEVKMKLGVNDPSVRGSNNAAP